MLDTLATKMIQGVKVRIVISTPGVTNYSDMKNMSQFSDLLRKRIALQTGSLPAAEQVMDRTLQYASLRSSDLAAWTGGVTLMQRAILPSALGVGARLYSQAV